MSVKRKAAKINQLKAVLEGEVVDRAVRLQEHGNHLNSVLEDLEKLYKELCVWLKGRAAKKAIKLHKAHREAKEALESTK